MSRILRFFSIFIGLVFFALTSHAAGYTCPAVQTYTSCSPGYYMTSSRTSTTCAPTPALGNACRPCSVMGSNYVCTGGTTCPIQQTVVTFNDNGGSGGPGTRTYTNGQTMQGLSPLPTRSGYKFMGYATTSTATAPNMFYANGNSFTTTWTNTSATLTLYAVWGCNPGYYYNNGTCTVCNSADSDRYYCLGGRIGRKACSSLFVNSRYVNALREYTSSGEYTISTNPSIWMRQAAATEEHCVCDWVVTDNVSQYRKEFLAEASCLSGPAATTETYTRYDDCKTGAYATEPLTWLSWYTNCAACTNKPANSHYTSYSTPPGCTSPTNCTAPYSTVSNCPWECDDGYVKNAAGTACDVKRFSVAFNSGVGTGGTWIMQMSCYVGEPCELPSAPPSTWSKTGHTFNGWAKQSGLTTGSYFVLETSRPANGTLTLYATWTPITTLVHFDNTGGTGGPADRTYTYGQKYADLPYTELPERTGYYFNGYYTSPTTMTTSTEVFFYDGIAYNSTWNYTATEMTLYAKWDPTQVLLTMDPNGGTGNTLSQLVYYDAIPTTIATASLPTRTNYQFLGYFDATSGGTQYFDANGVAVRACDKTTDTRLYAQWSQNSFCVNYNLNGGSGTTPGTSWCTGGVACTLNPGDTTTFYRAGYQLTGWKMPNGSTVSVMPKMLATVGTSLSHTATLPATYPSPGNNVCILATAVWTACGADTYKTTATTKVSDTTRFSDDNITAAGACNACPDGYSTNGNTARTALRYCTTAVAAGHYKPTSTSPGDQALECPVGTFSVGHASSGYGLAYACSKCTANGGSYTMTDGVGSTSENACKKWVAAGRSNAGCTGPLGSFNDVTGECSGTKTTTGLYDITDEYYTTSLDLFTSSTANWTFECPAGYYSDGHYAYYGVADNACKPCNSLGEGNYYEGGGGGATTCFMPSYDLSTFYIPEPYAAPVDCLPGYYCPGERDVYWGDYDSLDNVMANDSNIRECTGVTYSTGGASSCSNCPSIYTAERPDGKLRTSINMCQVALPPGRYIHEENSEEMTTCPGGYYCPGGLVDYGDYSEPIADGTVYNDGDGGRLYSCPKPNMDEGYHIMTITQQMYEDWFLTGNGITTAELVTEATDIGTISRCRVRYGFSSRAALARGYYWYNTATDKYDIGVQWSADGPNYAIQFWDPQPGYQGGKFDSCDGGSGNALFTNMQICQPGNYCPGGAVKCSNGAQNGDGSKSCIQELNLYEYSDGGVTATSSAACYYEPGPGEMVAEPGGEPIPCEAGEKESDFGQGTIQLGRYCPGGEQVYYGQVGGFEWCPEYRYGTQVNRYNGSDQHASNISGCYMTLSGGYFKLDPEYSEIFQCYAGSYKAPHNAYWDDGESCSVCGTNQYSNAGAASCTACNTANGYGNSGGLSSAHAGEGSCKLSCPGGSYVATAGGTCQNVGIGYWAAATQVSQDMPSIRTQCASPMTTIGSGAGADEAGDCGRILHIGSEKIYMRSDKKTTPSLNISINGKTFYGNMKVLGSGIKGLKVKGVPANPSATYTIFDDSKGY